MRSCLTGLDTFRIAIAVALAVAAVVGAGIVWRR
jgi:hypothetical protein